MKHDGVQAYGLWGLVIVNSVIFIVFALSFFKPQSRADWRSFGAFSAFLIALFIEMYGFPLTIYFLSGWLQTLFPEIDWLSHDAGHLLEMLFGWQGNPHFGPFHLASFVFIGAGFWLIAAAWRALHAAQKREQLATEGLYRYLRHPQYLGFILIMLGFILIMLGFLLQSPTLLTLAMFPVLTFMYVKLAIREERDSEARFGEAWRQYAAETPRFIPAIRRTAI